MYKYDLSSKITYEVFEYVKNFHLYDDFFTEDHVDYFLANIDEKKEFNFDSGATKLILIPNDKDYVIKIPFNGHRCTNCEYCTVCENPCECNEYECPIYPFEYAGGKFNDNYCEKEREIYDRIEEEYPEFKDFFLPLVLAGEIKHYPIYVQQKAEVLAETSDEICSVSEKSRSIVSSKDVKFCSAPLIWLAKCLENLNFDIEKYNKFIEMLHDLHVVGDLHRGNVGYYNNHAIILDYAGYYDG